MSWNSRWQKVRSSGLLRDLFTDRERTHTRKINPKLGALGVLGFLGFLGFLPWAPQLKEVQAVPPFFFFFAFFGFFGFYYEGRMSDTLIDERFQANACRASAIANRAALNLIILAAILATSMLRLDSYSLLGVLTAAIGLGFGLSVFLQQYLLYRFENEE